MEKHLIHLQKFKLRKQSLYESGAASWASCLLLMSLFSHHGVVFLPCEHCFKITEVINLPGRPVQCKGLFCGKI